jgi:hypothetical protein
MPGARDQVPADPNRNRSHLRIPSLWARWPPHSSSSEDESGSLSPPRVYKSHPGLDRHPQFTGRRRCRMLW